MEVMKKAKPQDIVYHYVKNQIVGKSMFPGNRIIEDDIIRETGTSRTSIRPALLRLKYEGLVEMIPNRGAFVAKPSEEDLRQVYRVREVLECGMMEDAIRKIDGVKEVSVNFMTQKMIVEFAEGADPKDVMKRVLKACKKVEPDCEIEL